MPSDHFPALALVALALGATLAAGPTGAPTRVMAVTVDDLPAPPSGDVVEMRRITDGVLAAPKRHRVKPVRLDLEPDPPQWVLDLYREAQR